MKRCLWTQAGHHCPRPALALVGETVIGHDPVDWKPRCAEHLVDIHRTYGEIQVVLDFAPIEQQEATTNPTGRCTTS
jgi:hypothetical protein